MADVGVLLAVVSDHLGANSGVPDRGLRDGAGRRSWQLLASTSDRVLGQWMDRLTTEDCGG
jgi:hypothetical protein